MYFAPVGFLAFTIGMRATWRKWMQRLRRRRSRLTRWREGMAAPARL